MSGDKQYEEDPDNSNEDFVIEDVGASGEDLEELFPTPALPGNPQAPKAGGGAPADEEDMLFEDHTKHVEASESFVGREQFAESRPSAWDGENLDLDAVGVPSDEATPVDGKLAEVRDTFDEELSNMLQAEEDFAMDSDQELELLDHVAGENSVAENNDEFEMSGAFVIDEGDGKWQERDESDETADAAPSSADETEDAGLEYEPLADDEEVAEGWEPLSVGGVDELSEVSEVARTDDEAVPSYEPMAAAEDPADVEGHDIYAEEQEDGKVVVGPRPRRSRVASMLITLAAMMLLSLAVGVVIARPEWFGIEVAPARLETVQIDRPAVKVAVEAPAVPPETAKLIAAANPTPVVTPPTPDTPDPTEVPVLATGPDVPPEVPPTTPPTTDPEVPVAVTPTPDAPIGDPVSVAPVVNGVPIDVPGNPEWPTAAAPPKPAPSAGLVRIGDDLLVGDQQKVERSVRAIEGVLPGSRAFAQLHNGNYFIGNVKCVDPDTLTLRLEHGEVTLPRIELAKLTELGSSDYDDLQRATSGFIRLTNNNRLVGGILSRIADDHIVLEFRSNRVMLPKSAIGEIVKDAQSETGVRLDTTREEDDWLRSLAERELGRGTPAIVETPGPGSTGEPQRR